VSTAVAPTEPRTRTTATNAALSLPSRLMATFSGTVGVVVKIVFLALVNAIAVWAATVLAQHSKWPALGALAAVTLAIDAAYLSKRTIPLKFLIPGTVFLLAFQVIPVLYTIEVAFTNWSTGHILAKDQAVTGIKANSLEAPPNGQSYTMAPARASNGDLVLVLVADEGGKTFVGTNKGLEAVPRADVKVDGDGVIVAAKGYDLVKGPALLQLDKELRAFTVPTRGDDAIRPEGLETALELRPTVRYDAKRDVFVRLQDGKVFRDKGNGSYAAGTEKLEPGWRTHVGFKNFSKVVTDPLYRDPFLRVFVWTVAFATLTVLFSFAVGLFLAITLNKPGMRFRGLYRTLLIVPYAIPGFLSLLAWQGLLNADFGVVNRVLHLDVPWLFEANWARLAIILVSVWLTFPYFFLVSLGALQSIPGELTEAALVDGGGRWQIFRKVTLPLLLIVVAPLLIASFAFNFNNFGNIYFLTSGGPASNDQSLAGATDILISYTYKIAFAAGQGNNFGLASTVSIFIFFIVATISAVTFSRTKALENVQ
jgi:arabinogalactan oligomer/maltooligosaccharide transport system permease protein